MTKWRKITGTFLRHHYEMHQDLSIAEDFFFDLSNEHGTSTANVQYQLDSHRVPGISPEQIIGCIRTCIRWQKIAGLGQTNPLRLTDSGQDPVAEAQAKALADTTGQEMVPIHSAGNITTGEFDTTALATELLHALEPKLNKTIDTRLKSAFIHSQKLYIHPPPPSLRAC
jgi:hypothetical protein